MEENILEITPEALRDVAKLVGKNLETDELLKVADELEKNGSYSVIRPAHRSTWINPAKKEAVHA